MKLAIEKRVFRSTIAGGVSFIFSIFQSIIIVPILLKFWGTDKYATWIALWSFVLLMRFFDVGFLSLIGNEFTIQYNSNKNEARKILASGFLFGFLLGFLELIFFIFLSILGFDQFFTGIRESKSNTFTNESIIVCLLPWAFGGASVSVLLRAIPALGHYDKMLYVSLLMKFIEIIVLVIAGFMNFSILVLSLLMTVGMLLYVFFLNFYIKSIIPDFYPWWKGADLYLGFNLFKKSLSLTVSSIVEQFLNNGIILLISNILGIIFLPLFTTIRTLTNLVTQVSSILLEPLTPDFIRLKISGQDTKLKHLFYVNWLFINAISSIFFVLSIIIIAKFYSIWTSGKLEFDLTLYMLLSVTAILFNTGRPYIIYLRGMNLVKSLNVISISRFLITILLGAMMLILSGLKGLAAVLLGTELICSIFIPWYFVKKEIPNINIESLKFALLPVLVVVMCMSLIQLDLIHEYILVTISIVFLSLLFTWQWRQIDDEVRFKLLSLIPVNIFKQK